MAKRSLVAQRIEEIRTSKGMTRQELADKLEISRLQVWRVETGVVELGADDVPDWAEALEASITSLYRESRAS